MDDVGNAWWIWKQPEKTFTIYNDNNGKLLEVLFTVGPYGRVCLSWLIAQRRIR